MKRILSILLLLIFIQNIYSQHNNTYLHNNIFYSKDEIVYTPFGPTLKSNGQYIDNNHYLEFSDSKIQIINKKTRKISQSSANKKVDLNINNLSNSNSSILTTPIQSTDGWITYSLCEFVYPNSEPTYLSTNYKVPSPPKNEANQLIYLFNGLEGYSGDTAYILQPVLQWGKSPAGGGKYWAICNWLVSNKNQFFFDTLIAVNPGDDLKSIIKMNSNNGNRFSYSSYFDGYPSTLSVLNLPRLSTPCYTFEAYNVKSCDQNPVDEKIRMQNIQIMRDSKYPPIYLHAVNSVDNCGQFTNIIYETSNGGEVNIHFHKPTSEEGFDDLFVYPNPIKNKLHISFTNPLHYCRLEIYDTYGRLFKTYNYEKLEYELYLNLQDLSSGVYVIKLYYKLFVYEKEKTYTQKIIKID